MEIPVGSAVKLDIPNLASETAIVRWSNDGITGLSFVSELRLISLRQWLDAHRHPYAGSRTHLAAPKIGRYANSRLVTG